jgi:diguanylate cyclase (GGDEF)-like protein
MDIHYYAIATLLLSAVMTGVLSAYSFRSFRTSGSRPYAFLMACVSIYSLGYAMELYNTTLPWILIASKIQYFGISFIPILWFTVAASYAGYWKKIPRTLTVLLFVIPVTTLFFRLTNDWHHLVYKAVALNESGPFPVLSITRGIWYYVNTTFAYCCLLAGNFSFLIMAIRMVGPYRKQAVTLGAISLVPWIGDMIYQRGLSPYGLDVAPFAFALVGPMLAWGLFHLRIFDFVPIARDVIFDFMHDPVIVFDNADRLVDYNRAAVAMLGSLDRRSIGIHAEQVFEGYPALLESLDAGFSDNRDIHLEYRGSEYVYELSTMPIVANVQRPMGRIVMLHDVTEQRGLVRRLHDMATRDGLTGAFTHRYFMDLAQREMDRAGRHGRPLTFMLADIDLFKQVNDKYGHLAGDEVLRKVAAIIRKNLRSSDVFGRYGGEEFGLVLPETLPEDGKALADRIRGDLAELSIPFGEQDITVTVTVSFGVSGCHFEDGASESLVSLFQRADKMLYKAKRGGRNRVVLAEENPKAESRLT